MFSFLVDFCIFDRNKRRLFLFPLLCSPPLLPPRRSSSSSPCLPPFLPPSLPQDLPVLVKTAAASATAASWRIFLMPVDTLKTIKQVEGKDGFKVLMAKMKVRPLPPSLPPFVAGVQPTSNNMAYTRVFIHTHTHIHIHIYIYMYTYTQ